MIYQYTVRQSESGQDSKYHYGIGFAKNWNEAMNEITEIFEPSELWEVKITWIEDYNSISFEDLRDFLRETQEGSQIGSEIIDALKEGIKNV